MHEKTYSYLMPTEGQLAAMEQGRTAVKTYSDALEAIMPDGPDKTYTIRKLREVAMWVNVAITRNPDGSPRTP